MTPDPEADRRRLDFLEARGGIEVIISGYGPLRFTIWAWDHIGDHPDVSVQGPTLRAAIDAAMARWAARGGEAP
jgi:hypothetical protein